MISFTPSRPPSRSEEIERHLFITPSSLLWVNITYQGSKVQRFPHSLVLTHFSLCGHRQVNSLSLHLSQPPTCVRLNHKAWQFKAVHVIQNVPGWASSVTSITWIIVQLEVWYTTKETNAFWQDLKKNQKSFWQIALWLTLIHILYSRDRQRFIAALSVSQDKF